MLGSLGAIAASTAAGTSVMLDEAAAALDDAGTRAVEEADVVTTTGAASRAGATTGQAAPRSTASEIGFGRALLDLAPELHGLKANRARILSLAALRFAAAMSALAFRSCAAVRLA